MQLFPQGFTYPHAACEGERDSGEQRAGHMVGTGQRGPAGRGGVRNRRVAGPPPLFSDICLP